MNKEKSRIKSDQHKSYRNIAFRLDLMILGSGSACQSWRRIVWSGGGAILVHDCGSVKAVLLCELLGLLFCGSSGYVVVGEKGEWKGVLGLLLFVVGQPLAVLVRA
ncbi:hypothetical protein RDI58_005037 [Solanum bulbocastanum]|uniref:Uncharacterized protein n=1 Tax=Solanum bulbocastanum TaxID=147425 RepID=A0AAN8YM14_SOLBU